MIDRARVKKLFPPYISILKNVVLQFRPLSFRSVWKCKDTNILLSYTFAPIINLSFATNFFLTSHCYISHCLTLQVPFAKELGNSPSITTSLLDAINDVIYHEATTHGLITSAETKTNSQSQTADVSRCRKISENSPSSSRLHDHDLHFT